MSTALPTPPPPSTPNSPETLPPALSEIQRLVNTFIAPAKTFEDIRRNASWWMPYLLVAVISLGCSMLILQKIDLTNFARQQIEQSKFAQQQFDQLSPEQQNQQLRIRAAVSKVLFFVAPISRMIVGLIIAA